MSRLARDHRPGLRAKLLAVHGVGPETADSILLYVLKKRFFVIDAYTKRIFLRHGLAVPSQDYQDWQQIFERALPPSLRLFNDFHAQIVNLGKDYCRASKPRCEICPLKSYL